MIIRMVARWPGAHRYLSRGPNGKKKDILFDACAYRPQAAPTHTEEFPLGNWTTYYFALGFLF